MAVEQKLNGVRAKLKAHKDANSGFRSVTLDESAVVCTIPKFINHGKWMRAQRIAKRDHAKAQVAFVAETVLFEGEKLNITEVTELLSAGDTIQLIGEVFGGDNETEGAGDDDQGNETKLTA